LCDDSWLENFLGAQKQVVIIHNSALKVNTFFAAKKFLRKLIVQRAESLHCFDGKLLNQTLSAAKKLAARR
jgi:hypothetical protein